jgi:hypothetical protein
MANQLQITGDTRVKSLTGVLVGTTGVVSSLNIDGSYGIPQLDVNGKILVSQLPNSVMEYKGTWDASTNTPTLANGTGNQGDVYLCNVAGTVNFGAGAIAFVVGDQVIYSGSIWQRASGATGTVTSVAVTESGDSLNITGSPITTSGTINIGFNGSNLQYVNGAGNLTTFPILTGYVTAVSGTAPVVSSGGTTPAISMAAATASVDGYLSAVNFAIFNAKQSALTFSSPLVNTSGTISIPVATTSVNGYLASADWSVFNAKQNAITLTTVGSSGVATLTGATLNIPNYAPDLSGYVTLATTQTISGAKTFSGGVTFSSSLTTTSNLTFSNSGFFLTLQPPTLGVNRTVTLPNGTGTLALTSDISYPVSSVFGRTGAVVATSGDYTTAQVTESGNLYFTDSRARLALSFVAGSGAYNSTTGVITIPTNNNQITNGSSYITLASLSGSSPIIYNNATGAISIQLGTDTQNGYLSSTDRTAFNNKQDQFTVTGPLTFTSLNLAMAAATTSVNGYLTAANFTTFNNKQGTITLTTTGTSGAATFSSNTLNIPQYQGVLTNPVTGTGTTNYLPKFTGASTIGNSQIFDNGTNVGIGTASPLNRLFVTAATAGDYAAFIENTNSTNGFGLVARTAHTGTSAYAFAARAGATDIFIVRGDGRVGIGNTSPAYLLDVSGTGNFTGALNGTSASFSSSITANSTGGVSGSFISNTFFGSIDLENTGGTATGKWNLQAVSGAQIGGSAGSSFGIYSYGASAYRLFISGAGNVLIGTTTDAGYKLDVNGTGRFTGALSGTSASFSSGATFGSTVRPITNFAADLGTSSFRWAEIFGYSINLTNNATISGTLGVTGAATFSSTIDATRFISNVTNNYGLVLNRTAVTTYNGMSLQTAGTAKWFLGMRENLSSNNYIIYSEQLAADVLKLDVSTGAATFSSRVNINGATDNSAYALNIYGDATFSGTRATPAYIYAVRGGDDSKLILKAGSTAGYFSQLDVSGWNGTGTPAYISLNAGSGTGIYINNGNNVLIGTTTDSGYKLDVNGTARFSGSANSAFIPLTLSNTSTGTGARNILQFTNNVAGNGLIELFGGGYTSSGGGDDVADGFRIFSNGSGGMAIISDAHWVVHS